MQQERVRRSGAASSEEHHGRELTGQRHYMRFRCIRCNHCVSPGMFTPEGWAVYKKTELCPDCQK